MSTVSEGSYGAAYFAVASVKCVIDRKKQDNATCESRARLMLLPVKTTPVWDLNAKLKPFAREQVLLSKCSVYWPNSI